MRSQQRRHDSECYAGMPTSKLAGMKVPEVGTERYRRAVDTLHCVIEGYWSPYTRVLRLKSSKNCGILVGCCIFMNTEKQNERGKSAR